MEGSSQGSPEGQDSVQDENNHLLESTLSRMANYFERQEGRMERGEKAKEVSEDLALERFQKFRPPKYNGKGGEESAEKWIEAMDDIF